MPSTAMHRIDCELVVVSLLKQDSMVCLQVDKSNMELQRWKSAASEKKTVLNIRKFRLRCRNLVPFGIADAFRGVGAAFVGTIPVALIYFAVYERVHLHFPVVLSSL